MIGRRTRSRSGSDHTNHALFSFGRSFFGLECENHTIRRVSTILAANSEQSRKKRERVVALSKSAGSKRARTPPRDLRRSPAAMKASAVLPRGPNAGFVIVASVLGKRLFEPVALDRPPILGVEGFVLPQERNQIDAGQVGAGDDDAVGMTAEQAIGGGEA